MTECPGTNDELMTKMHQLVILAWTLVLHLRDWLLVGKRAVDAISRKLGGELILIFQFGLKTREFLFQVRDGFFLRRIIIDIPQLAGIVPQIEQLPLVL